MTIPDPMYVGKRNVVSIAKHDERLQGALRRDVAGHVQEGLPGAEGPSGYGWNQSDCEVPRELVALRPLM